MLFAPGGCLAGPPHRIGEHDGIYSPAFQPVPDRRCFRAFAEVGDAAFSCREALVEMDVPTRQSYVAAWSSPNERTFASGITNLARNVFWAVGSAVAGFFMQNVALAAPLAIGGAAKIGYDVLLYRAFGK